MNIENITNKISGLNKFLHLDNFYFALPDKFDGSLSDALRLVADRLETPQKTFNLPYAKDAYMNFTEVLQQGGKLLIGEARLLIWDEHKEYWKSNDIR